MRKLGLILAVFLMTALYNITVVLAQTGNGAPNGPHYNLNIIGVTNGKKPPLTGSDRHTIFVPLVSDQGAADTDTSPGADIFLTQGPFTVCDGNTFDPAYDCFGNKIAKQGAVFQLPCNQNITTATGTTLMACTNTGPGSVANYEVWARVVGTPGGNGTITTCAIDATNTEVCSMDTVLVRNKPNRFSNVTDALTSLVSGTSTFSLFSGGFVNFFWDYDNNGNKLLQLRFYLM